MPPDPLVSVVVPSRNYGKFLAEAVGSIRAQGVAGVEVLVVDDGSTDETPEVLAALAGPDLRAFRLEGRGVSAARNLGIEQARGRYLAYLDADDRWLPGKLARQLEVLESEPGVGFVFSDFARFGPEGRYPDTQFDFIPGLAALPTRPSRAGGARVLEADTLESLVGVEQFPAWLTTVLMRREGVDDLRFPDGVRLNQDQHYMYRVYPRLRAAWIESPLAEVRRHGGNSYRSAADKLVPEVEVLQSLLGEPFTPRHRAVLKRRLGRAWCALGYHHFWRGGPRQAGRAYFRALACPGARVTSAAHLLALPLVPLLPRKPDARPG